MVQQSNSAKVIKGLSSQTLVTLLNGVAGIVLFSIMSRLLTQEDFGYFAAVTAITMVFDSLSETGIGSALVQRKELNQQFIDNAYTISIICGFFIALSLFLLSEPLAQWVVDENMITPLRWISLTLLCHCISSVNLSILQRELKFLTIGLINLVGLLISSVVCIILAVYGFGFYSILARAVLSSVIILILSFWFAKKKFKLHVDKETCKSIWGFSGWLMASALFRNFAQQIDRLLMTKTLSVVALGMYNRPKEFISLISTRINSIFDMVLFPVLSGVQDNKDSLKRSYRYSTYYLNVFSMLLALSFIFNSDLIICIFFGQEWLSVKTVFICLSMALVFNIDGRLSDCYLRSLALTSQQFYFRILELIIKVIGFFVGVRWGVAGVALSVVISYFVIVAIKFLYVSSKIGISAKETILLVFNSWRFGLFIGSVMICLSFFNSSSLLGNFITLIVFVILVLLSFVIFPQIVGNLYATDMYVKMKSKMFSKISKR